MQKSLFRSRKFLNILTSHNSILNLHNVSIVDFGACLTSLMFYSYQFMIVTCICK